MDVPAALEHLYRQHYTLGLVAVGAGALGVVSGGLGAFAVLRKQSLLGDAISHAALPGIALAYLLTGSKAPLVLVCGAALAGWLATLLVLVVVRTTVVKDDAALGLVLSVFFGFGLVLLTYVQKHVPQASQAGLDRYLFGQAATLLEQDVLTVLALGGLALGVLALFWKEFKLLTFDPGFAASLGVPVRRFEVLLTGLLVLAIVTGLHAVGVVLMSALVVAPAAAARQWTDRLGRMVVLSAAFGAAAGVAGALLSGGAQRLPTGPVIVLCASAIVLVSLLGAPRRGLVWSGLAHWRSRRQLRLAAVLADLDTLARQHEAAEHGHPAAVLQAMSLGQGDVRRSLRELEARGWARRVGPDLWAVTPAGRDEARRAGPPPDRPGDRP